MAEGIAAKLIRIAKAEVGYREGRNASGSYNNDQKYSDQTPGLEWSDRQAWCQTFQSWLAMKAGSASYEPRTASCRTACDWFKQRGRFSEYPAIGAQVFFGAGGGSHVGRVWKYDADYVWTIEGNTNDNGSAEGNGVYLRKRARRDSYLHGYGMPTFPEGVITADPSLKGKPGYTWRATADAPPAAVTAPAGNTNVPEDKGMKLNDRIKLSEWAQSQWPADKKVLAQGIFVSTALSSSYVYSRKAVDNTNAILAQLRAQAATIDKLADAVGAAQGFDPESLKREIREAVESIKISLVTGE